ncbi:MAG: sensor domain-containing protein [Thermoanaerobaculia bacterium]
MSPKKATTGPRARRPPPRPVEGLRVRTGGPPASGEGSEEVLALIATLHETGMRLEELTAGEVDSVADGFGRPLLLRHAQDEVRHAEAARQAAILNALPAHVALLDFHGRILSVNETWRRFADANAFRSPDHGVGLNYLDVCDYARGKGAEGAREVAEGVRAVLGGGAPAYTVEYPCHSPERVRWFLLMVTPLVHEQPGGAVVVHVDITERRAADDQLRESEGRFRQFAETIRDAFFLVEVDGSRMLYVSPAYEEIWGRSCESLYARPRSWIEAIHRDDQAAVKRQFAEEVAAKPFTMEYRIVRPGGELRWIEARSFPVRDGTGKVVRIAGLAKDVTELRRTARELHESERRFSEMLENVELVSLMLDREARVTYCNEFLLRLTGWRQEEILGRNVFDFLIPPEEGGLGRKDFLAMLGAGVPEHRENEILTRAGARRLIRWNNSILRSEDGGVIGIAGLGEDVTEQKQAEDRVRRLNRVYAVLSAINSLIVRVQDKDELFREVCRICVELGGFRMSLLGIVDPATHVVDQLVSAGKDEVLLAAIRERLQSAEGVGSTMIAQAICEKTPVVANDLESDSRVVLGHLYAGAGVRASAVLPLIVAGEPVGVLALYASEPQFFHDEEMRLLKELTGDVAFAMDHIEKKDRLDYLAYYDALTGLANRTLFLERVRQLQRIAASGGHQLALFLIDLERFRNVNETFGRLAGDEILMQVAQVLTRFAGDETLLARVGADQFAAVLPEVRSGGDLLRLLDRIAARFLDHPFHLNGAVFRIGARAGGALFPQDGADADRLYRNAEAALKRAKKDGDRFLFYTQGMTEAAAVKLTMESQLRDALAKEEFVLHYQPKVNLASGRITGTEALIRWNDPRTAGLVPPGSFIPVLEETGLIHDVGRWALGKAVEDYLRWRDAGLPAVRVAVNVSPLQLRGRGFVDEVRQFVGSDPHAAAGLELEITESLIMEDVKHSIDTLQSIRALGVTVAIDDFGTGFSSLSYLSRLPVDSLKIDRSFVTDMTAGPEGLSLVSTIINLAHSLKLNVVAEGVETEEQARLLRLLGCDEMQGFLFSKAVPAELFEARFLAPPPG